ncbi:hypothetical protein [Winogradskyella alexanderae]|uniref:Uncharacterized protein n=1 Tax=Winogradskyella alexanderae TaxID=2877123 RepID=A0ABS7XRE1_9FLAO|nr:hypothetical protein [Winogradskyella alexanderae]MCA0132059.1 hypothetical protein [Winogradskyella alexanderae]
MIGQISRILLLLFFVIPYSVSAQPDQIKKSNKLRLFEENKSLPIKFKYSKKQLKNETNDSTYMIAEMSYEKHNGIWDTLEVKIRARGNFRRKSCFFTPIKLKVSKKNAKGTLFEKNRKLKVVFPCLNEYLKDDYVMKEYIIYKMYEVVMPYHFKTRLIEVEFDDVKNKKIKTYQLKGFLIEDYDKVAKRLEGRVVKRAFYPQGYDDLFAVRNAMFQFMVGNTDFSATYSHNSKVIYVDKKFVPIPYDFDMSGFVNTSYSVVSKTRKAELPIENVTERYYMGYRRDIKLFEKVRLEFLNNRKELLSVIDNHKNYFESQQSFETAKSYIKGFFKILEDRNTFKRRTYDIALNMD